MFTPIAHGLGFRLDHPGGRSAMRLLLVVLAPDGEWRVAGRPVFSSPQGIAILRLEVAMDGGRAGGRSLGTGC